MAGHRIERIAEDIKRELTAIFRELRDPRVMGAMLSIVRVEVTGDLYYCRVYVSSVEGADKTSEAVLGLQAAVGYIKHELGSRLKLRRIPDLIFIATDSIEYGAYISKMLNQLEGE